jgi:hypothetical protein
LFSCVAPEEEMFKSRVRFCAAALMSSAQTSVDRRDAAAALATLDSVKALPAPVPRADYLRAVSFLLRGDALPARQACLEELRFFPQSHEAADLLLHLDGHLRDVFTLPEDVRAAQPIFAMAYDAVQPFTMLNWPRLLSLFLQTRDVCEQGIEGDIVECGVAAGGGSVVMAVAVQHFSTFPRRHFACDTFSGMPPPGAQDLRKDDAVPADASRWGLGTCAAPMTSVQRLGGAFGADIIPVVGLYNETLPTFPSEKIAMLHVDADWYESTKTALSELHPRLVPRARVQVDDYGYWEGCRTATDEFMATLARKPTINEVDGIAISFINE